MVTATAPTTPIQVGDKTFSSVEELEQYLAMLRTEIKELDSAKKKAKSTGPRAQKRMGLEALIEFLNANDDINTKLDTIMVDSATFNVVFNKEDKQFQSKMLASNGRAARSANPGRRGYPVSVKPTDSTDDPQTFESRIAAIKELLPDVAVPSKKSDQNELLVTMGYDVSEIK